VYYRFPSPGSISKKKNVSNTIDFPLR
jgi:hypothetical protein